MFEVLLHPQRIAVIGASRKPGKVGYEVLANLQRSGFAGRIVPVKPSGEDVVVASTGETQQKLREALPAAVAQVVAAVSSHVFPGHGLQSDSS